jgi:hypothetical protein
MRISMCLFGLLAIACSGGERDGGPSQDLLHALADSGTADHLTPTQRGQLERCVYVYDADEKIRECLVLGQGWEPEVAAKAIAYHEAERGRITDSVIAAVKARMTERRQAAADARRAEQRRRDSVYRATHREWLDGPVVDPGPDASPYMLDTRTMAYYSSGCRAARRIPVAARRFFGYESDLPAKAWPSKQEGCTAGGS